MAQTGAATQAVYTQGSCARQGVSMDTDSGCGKVVQGTAKAAGKCRGQLTEAMDQQQGHAGLQLRLKLGCRQGQWRLGYCGCEQAAGKALTALVVAVTAAAAAKELRAMVEAGRGNEKYES